MSALRLAGILLALLALLGCADDEPGPPNVLIVVADTLRADRLGAYGNDRGLTPFLDRLAARATVFQNAIAQSPYTDPSIASLFTSRFPSQHGVVWLNSGLRAEEVTLAELLRERGYRTGGFSANPGLTRKRGFAQGFDEFRRFELLLETHGDEIRWSKKRAPVVNRAALDWLDAGQGEAGPTLLYVHYMEPHLPFSPPKSALRRVFGDGPVPDLETANLAHLNGRDVAPDAETQRAIEDFYGAEIASLDADLEALFEQLEERGFLENALVVFTSDHGEEFFERGFSGHGHTLYGELIRVPLLIRTPQQTQRVDVQQVVSLIDVAPSVVAWLDGEVPPSFEGRALLSGDASASPAFSELMGPQKSARYPHERAVVAESRKLIVGSDAKREFFDLASDPGETKSGALSRPDRQALSRTLTRFIEANTRAKQPGPEVPLDDDEREQLRALGYGD